MKIESDRAAIVSGVRHGRTLGTPIALRIENADWPNWRQEMSAAPGDAKKQTHLTIPRPGHADLAGMQKYGLDDVRSVLERASARETAARVAVGSLARILLSQFGVTVVSHVTRIGEVETAAGKKPPALEDFQKVDDSPVRCLDEEAAGDMVAAIDNARKNGESLGGVFEILVFGLVPGLGSYASGPERLGGRIGGALMSIPAIKGAEIGGGFELAEMPGSAVHDEIIFDEQAVFTGAPTMPAASRAA